MILANVAAAETLEAQRTPLLYRVHDAPIAGEARGAARVPAHARHQAGQGRARCRPAHFNGILRPRRAATTIEALVNEVVLRSQSQAEYQPENYRPFRPQPAPLRAFHLADPPLCRPDRPSRADPRAEARRRTAYATGRTRPSSPRSPSTSRPPNGAPWRPSARPSTGWSRLISPTASARSSTAASRGVTRAGLFVKLDETGADGFVPAATLGDDYFRFEEAAISWSARRPGESFQLGDVVSVDCRGRAVRRRIAVRNSVRWPPHQAGWSQGGSDEATAHHQPDGTAVDQGQSRFEGQGWTQMNSLQGIYGQREPRDVGQAMGRGVSAAARIAARVTSSAPI